jgi:SAM-dependent methyltransferase
MGYFHDKQNVLEYIEMSKGYVSDNIVNLLRDYLPNDSTVLEIGMGPGHDLDLLRKFYKVTGSDNSQHFLDYYYEKDPEADLLLLDAITLNIDATFDCIYSNKVLIHLTRDELIKSIQRQASLLKNDGYLIHSFWRGSGDELIKGLYFHYYEKQDLEDLFTPYFEVVEVKFYKELDEADSILILLKKKQ